MLSRLILVFSLFAFILVAGCGGVNEEVIKDAEQRLDALEEKGVPDDDLSDARVYLFQAKSSMEKGNNSEANKAGDSLKIHLEKAEKLYQEKIATLGPKIDALKEEINKTKEEELSGLHAKKVDSVMAVVDSFVKIDWLLQAKNEAEELKGMLPNLKKCQSTAKKIKNNIPGVWKCVTRATSKNNPAINAVEQKIFTFYRNGKAKMIEKKKGQSGPFLKEDWEFRSNGTFDLVGDTIVLLVDRFAAVKQDFTRIHKVDGKKVWKHEPAPTYDSTITDGSQDRFITYDDLKLDFKKIRRL
ncbi:MAG: hypothetical protein ACLFQB_01310 [Chitinispirillaceae bacterium]